MNNWIKPSELPKDFWSECFIYFENDLGSLPVYVAMVRKPWQDKAEIYSDIQNCWEALSDNEYRIMIIDKPESPRSIK